MNRPKRGRELLRIEASCNNRTDSHNPETWRGISYLW